MEGGESSGAKAPCVRKALDDHRAEKLARETLEGNWKTVTEMYEKFPGAHTQRISDDDGNTALHVAVDLDNEEVVMKLVKEIIKYEEGIEVEKKALELKNKNGDTALHIAASRGFTNICRCVIGESEKRKHLLRLENKKGETPFFLAALNWHKHCFAYLSFVLGKLIKENDVDIFILMTRGSQTDKKERKGESILHCAINRECFDLAFILAHEYAFLTRYAHNGSTPLHLLAKRPSAFQSTTKLSHCKQLLYHDAKKEKEKCNDEIKWPPLSNNSKKKEGNESQRDEHDEENASKYLEKLGIDQFFPPNYNTILEFIKSVYVHSFLIRLVHGFKEVRGTKQKHVWCDILLTELMGENAYDAFTGKGGDQPHRSISYKDDANWGFDLTEDLYNDDDLESAIRRLKEAASSSNKQEKNTFLSPSGTTRAPTDQKDDSKEGITKSGDLILKCCDCVVSNVKNVEDCERIMKPMLPQLLMKCGCGRTDCKRNIAAAIAVADHTTEDTSDDNDSEKETPYLLAAKNGIIELVTKIREKIPSAIHSTNAKNQNVLLVAVKNRQPEVVLKLKKTTKIQVWNNLVIGVDDDENTLLHLAAEGLKGDKSWQIAGSALQMMWDIKWYEYIKTIVPTHCHFRSNKDSKTAAQIFNKSHEVLIQEASQWLKDTSESCSVVAALVAGVSFATASNVPGGYDNGQAPLEGQPAFEVFAMASLVGLCFSVTGLIMFLSILTSRKVAKDFRRSLPLKLLAGLSSLFVSIITMFVSFCSGHFFLVNHKYKSILFPLYAATSIPVAFYAFAQFPLYLDLLTAILTTIPTTSDVGEIL
ncbi:uncharacterized protein LOC107610163 isoform X2 [Arachis ipaensis]|uniref:uncharacterized protein LOC107610163 isoform X2 n=1 Tax=Arachis ipaensis TaxID=130454 RepID=UPI000A2B1C9B|nr:uncharacterized protein LOC107610163 isoform X2 [Arachis ipaensis]